jgi:hypothetical protein
MVRFVAQTLGGRTLVCLVGPIPAIGPSVDNMLYTGHQLWSSGLSSYGGTVAGIHLESPIVVGRRLYCPDESGQLTAYSL